MPLFLPSPTSKALPWLSSGLYCGKRTRPSCQVHIKRNPPAAGKSLQNKNYVGVQVWTRAYILHKQHGGSCGGPAHLPAGYAVHIVDITCLCCSFIVRFCERAEVLLLERQRIAQPGVLNKCRIIERVKMIGGRANRPRKYVCAALVCTLEKVAGQSQ